MDILTIVTGWLGSSIEQYQKRVLASSNEAVNVQLQRLMRNYLANQTTFDDAIDEFLVIYNWRGGAGHIVAYVRS